MKKDRKRKMDPYERGIILAGVIVFVMCMTGGALCAYDHRTHDHSNGIRGDQKMDAGIHS